MSTEDNSPDVEHDSNQGDQLKQTGGLAGFIREHPLISVAIFFIAGVGITALIGLVIGFRGTDGEATPSPPPTLIATSTATATEAPTATATTASPTATPQMMFEPNNYFIPNQIILTAPDNDGSGTERIQSVLGTLQNQGVLGEYNADRVIRIQAFSNNSSEEIQESSSNKLQASTLYCPGLTPEHLTFVVALAEFDEGTSSVEELLAAFNELDDSVKDGVTAEPNLIVGSPDYPTGSTSTWDFTAAKTLDYFSQWAFGNIELIPPNPVIIAKRVRVVVLDAVPSAHTRPQETIQSDTATIPGSSIIVNWIDENAPWTLGVSFSQPASVFSLPEGADPTKDLSHHGLFGAQMVHAIAPNSDIELVEVLNEEVIGNLYTLIVAFNDRVLNYQDQEEPNSDIPTVVNMSLGIRIPPPKANFDLPEAGMEALYAVMQVAHCRNIVVVAASGNNSQMSYPPELAHLPAHWSSVIAVSASNMEYQRSCFSNQGEIAAPGGDGRKPDEDPLTCDGERLRTCNAPSCPYGVVGPIMPSSEYVDGLIYWSGSSFASPMVAGLAARILSESPVPLSPHEVRHIIECGATEATFPEGIEGHPDRHIGEGVINVEKTLNECMPTAP